MAVGEARVARWAEDTRYVYVRSPSRVEVKISRLASKDGIEHHWTFHDTTELTARQQAQTYHETHYEPKSPAKSSGERSRTQRKRELEGHRTEVQELKRQRREDNLTHAAALRTARARPARAGAASPPACTEDALMREIEVLQEQLGAEREASSTATYDALDATFEADQLRGENAKLARRVVSAKRRCNRVHDAFKEAIEEVVELCNSRRQVDDGVPPLDEAEFRRKTASHEADFAACEIAELVKGGRPYEGKCIVVLNTIKAYYQTLASFFDSPEPTAMLKARTAAKDACRRSRAVGTKVFDPDEDASQVFPVIEAECDKPLSSRCLRSWRQRWEVHRAYPGVAERPGILWMTENDGKLLAEAKKWARANSQQKGKPNLTAEMFADYLNNVLLKEWLAEKGRKQVSLRTATYYLHRMDFSVKHTKKASIYIDRHNDPDIVDDRQFRFIPEFNRYHQRTRRYCRDGLTKLDDLADERAQGADKKLGAPFSVQQLECNTRFRDEMEETGKAFYRKFQSVGHTDVLAAVRRAALTLPLVGEGEFEREYDLRTDFLQQERWLNWRQQIGDWTFDPFTSEEEFLSANGFKAEAEDVPSGYLHKSMRFDRNAVGKLNPRVVCFIVQDEAACFSKEVQSRAWAMGDEQPHAQKNNGTSTQISGFVVEDGNGLLELTLNQTLAELRRIWGILTRYRDAQGLNAPVEASQMLSQLRTVIGEREFVLAFESVLSTKDLGTNEKVQERARVLGLQAPPGTQNQAKPKWFRDWMVKHAARSAVLLADQSKKSEWLDGLIDHVKDDIATLRRVGKLPPPRPQMAKSVPSTVPGKTGTEMKFAGLSEGLQADVYLKVGKGCDGYWTGERFLTQAGHAFLVAELRRPGEEIVLSVDHSSNHAYFGDGLRTADMCVGDNMKSAPSLRTTQWVDDAGDTHEQVIGKNGLVTVLLERQKITVVQGKACGLDRRTKLTKEPLQKLLDEEDDFKHEKCLLEKLAEERGHTILWGVKCHPELQYIEQKWGLVKPRLKKNNRGTTKGFIWAVFEAMRGAELVSLQRFARKSRDILSLYELGAEVGALKGLLKTKRSHRGFNGLVEIIAR
jgi:hypothetical protein